MYCGGEVHDEAVICVKCGRSIETTGTKSIDTSSEDDTMSTVAKVFLIIGCIAQGWLILPLAWCLPITITVFNSIRDKKPIGTGIKVCALLFVNLIAGICLLCMNDDKKN